MTLRLKLLVLVAGVTLFATTGITALSLWRGLAQSQEHLSCEGAVIAASAASAASAWLAPGGAVPGADKALVPVLERTLASAPLAAAWVIDRNGGVGARRRRRQRRRREGAWVIDRNGALVACAQTD